MSSKQIFKLPTILEDSEKTVIDYHVREECRKKAIIYEIKQKQLKAQIHLAKTSKELQDQIITNAASKLALIDTLIPLLKKQSNVFQSDRLTNCETIYKHMRELDVMPKHIESMAIYANELSCKINDFAKQIEYLENGTNVHF